MIGRALLAVLATAGAAWGAGSDSYATIARGLYLTRAGDCAACHTVDPARPMAGNYALPTPFGTIYSANLTPDPETGIGGWSADDFWRAMHEGRSADKGRLYPAFPYTHFTNVTREDSDAILAYLRTLQPVSQRVPDPDLPWPLDWRQAMRGWNLAFFDEAAPFREDPSRSASWNRGRYLVEGLGHCAMCHSPKNIAGAERGGDLRFTGGMAEGWLAPSLTQDPHAGLGDWTRDEIVSFLKHGRNGRAIAFGPMRDVIEDSTRYLTDEDLGAIADYLMSLPASPAVAPPAAKPDDRVIERGALVYAAQCSACHAPDGEGVPGMFPALAGSSLLQSADPTTVLRLILGGAQSATTDAYPTASAMPPFGWKLDDATVAAVATYVRNAFGNAAAPVPAAAVEAERAAMN